MANIINYRRFSLHARYPREILEKQGHSVQEAANGRLGLELVTKVRRLIRGEVLLVFEIGSFQGFIDALDATIPETRPVVG